MKNASIILAENVDFPCTCFMIKQVHFIKGKTTVRLSTTRLEQLLQFPQAHSQMLKLRKLIGSFQHDRASSK